MAILLSLLAAASYGLADFCGGFASKRASAWSVALLGALTGSVLIRSSSRPMMSKASRTFSGRVPTYSDVWPAST